MFLKQLGFFRQPIYVGRQRAVRGFDLSVAKVTARVQEETKTKNARTIDLVMKASG
jgi:hypothetical protein